MVMAVVPIVGFFNGIVRPIIIALERSTKNSMT